MFAVDYLYLKNEMQGFYRNHMEEVIKFFETHHKVIDLNFYTYHIIYT